MKIKRMLSLVLVPVLAVSLFSCVKDPGPDSTTESGTSSNSETVGNNGKYQEYNTVADYKAATGKAIDKFKEAPMLADMVKAGKLPPVEQRISDEPLVCVPSEAVGTYGGSLVTPLRSNGSEMIFDHPMTAHLDENHLFVFTPNYLKDFKANEDGTEYVLTLRKGLKWSDGKPLTSADFQFTYDDYLNNPDFFPSGNGGYKGADDKMAVLTVVDEQTFKMTFSAPNYEFTRKCYRPDHLMPKHYMSQFHNKYNQNVEKEAINSGFSNWTALFEKKFDEYTNIDLPVVGPYKLSNYKEGVISVYTRNPYYWKVDIVGNQLPYIDEIRAVATETDALITQCIAGDVDVATRSSLNMNKNFSILKENETKGNYKLYETLSNPGYWGVIYFNFASKDANFNELVNRIEFRQALSMAMDREDINNVLYKGLRRPTQINMADPMADHDDPVFEKFVEHDVDAANALMDKLGYSWDEKHEFRTYKDGSRMDISMIAQVKGEEKTENRQIAEMYQKQFKDIGINLIVKALEGDAMDNKWNTGDYELAAIDFNVAANKDGFPGRLFCENGRKWYLCFDWAAYYATNGAEGSKPPENVRLIYDAAGMRKRQNLEQNIALERKCYHTIVENLYVIANLYQTEKACYVNSDLYSNKLGNVPDPVHMSEINNVGIWMFYKK